ncbi:MAG: sugar kinase [Bilophila wadsworthia]
MLTCETLGGASTALLAGDTGTATGAGSLQQPCASSPVRVRGITFHYLFPDLDGHNRVIMALEEADPKPVLVADAGFMYVAKMSGYADAYDLFTPDAGELAFLADEKAPHPFYTRGFLLAADEDIPSLVERAYQYGNAARFLLIKGKVDHLVEGGRFLGDVSEPQVAALPIGGTGDLVTGLVTGLPPAAWRCPACLTAARASRIPLLANPTPRRRSRNCCPSSPKRCAALWRGPPPLCAPPGRETVQTRAAPSLRILTEKPPSSRLGAFFTRQPEPFQAIPMATTFPESPFRWISFAHPTNTKRPDRLSI